MATIDTRAKAVIYPAHTVSGYGHIYSLGLAGVGVTALSPVNCGNFRSRYVREKFIVPDPCVNHERFVEWLVCYGGNQETKPVLFMAEDLYSYIASLYQERLKPFFHFSYIPLEKLDILFNKFAMYSTAMAAGLKVPHGLFQPISRKELDAWPCYPAVVKPVVSRFKFKGTKLMGICSFQHLFDGKAIFASNPMDLWNLAGRLQDADVEFCVQEYIPGDNSNLFTVYFVADHNGNIPSYSTHYKVRQFPADFGTTSVSQSEAVPQLRVYAEQFCKHAGYTGPATMEFKLSARDGNWYLMEINPRLGFAVRRSTIKGVNMVLQQYLLSTGQRLLASRQRDGGRCWIDIPGDIKGLLWRRKKKQWRLSNWQIFKPYFFFSEAIFNLKDPMPGLARLRTSLLRALQGRTRQSALVSDKRLRMRTAG
jgi:D-aspartate ligase